VKGHEFLDMLLTHYRKYKGSHNREIVFVVSGKPVRYRAAQVTPDGKVTRVVLVEA